MAQDRITEETLAEWEATAKHLLATFRPGTVLHEQGDRLFRLIEEFRAAREALEPFAAVGRDVPARWHDDEVYWIADLRTIHAGTLRRAAEALPAPKPADPLDRALAALDRAMRHPNPPGPSRKKALHEAFESIMEAKKQRDGEG